MRPALALAGSLAFGIVTTAWAAPLQDVRQISQPMLASQELVREIRSATASARTQAGGLGLTGAALEGLVSEQVETVIGGSGSAPVDVLGALQLAMAQEQCLVLPDGRFAVTGCRALADLVDIVSAALGGPAAIGGTGTVPSAAGAPPSAANGSDYAN